MTGGDAHPAREAEQARGGKPPRPVTARRSWQGKARPGEAWQGTTGRSQAEGVMA